jgi:DNA polymerase-1
MSSVERIYLIDGHALAYRTYYALTGTGDASRWTTKSGEPTAGTYGFTSVLLRLIDEEKPDYLAVAFDTGRTFRDDIFPEYKATREKMPEDLRPQIARIKEVVEAFGIPILEADGFEADDVLGTVARKAAHEGLRVVIVTGDRDLLQLADDHIVIQLSGRKLSEAVDHGIAEVRRKLGIEPAQLPDYKALVGDKSDNIPGVHGVGEKTATSLLEKYHSLEGIYEHLDEISSRFREKLLEGRDSAFLSRRLAIIRTDVPVDFELQSCHLHQFERARVAELFQQLEFFSLLNRLPSEENETRQLVLFTSSGDAQAPERATTSVVVVDSDEGLADLSRQLKKAGPIAFDVETTSTDAMRAELVGIALAIEPQKSFYIPCGHLPNLAGGEQLPLPQILEALRPALTDSRQRKIGHNLKYDYILLARNRLRVEPLRFDTMIAEWLCDPASHNLGLKKLAFTRLGKEMQEIEELIGRGRQQRTMAEIPIAQVAPYAGADAETCLELMPILEKELKHKQQWQLFQDLEMPLVPILAEMEMAGIALDTRFLHDLSAQLSTKLNEIETRIYALVGHPFNINSTQQLSQVMYDELGLEPPDRTRRTASGHYSTAASVLEELREAHPLVNLVLEHREIAKLRSTYTDALPAQVNPQTSRLHTSYNQTGTVTGRLASSEPNLQNIPIRTELGRQIRRAFVAGPGQLLLGVDYSQIELRIVAHAANDEAMLDAFRHDQDIHATTAAAVFGCALEEVTPAMRRRAKAVNFGLIYGMSPYGLSRSTDLTLAEAEDFVREYFQRFPGVKRYLEEIRHFAAAHGYVETLIGRRRYFPELKSAARPVSEATRARATREAINAPIQGTAADIIKLAMLRLPQALRDHGLRGRMLLQVHDELVLECPEKELKATAQIVQEIMRTAFALRVALKTDASAGPNWAEMDPIP